LYLHLPILTNPDQTGETPIQRASLIYQCRLVKAFILQRRFGTSTGSVHRFAQRTASANGYTLSDFYDKTNVLWNKWIPYSIPNSFYFFFSSYFFGEKSKQKRLPAKTRSGYRLRSNSLQAIRNIF